MEKTKMIDIAICDDEPIFKRQLKHLVTTELELCGASFRIHTFSDGQTLLNAYDKFPFQLLLLDIKLPGIDGISAAKILRQRGFKGDIILITNYDDYVFEGYEVQALHYLLKPINPIKLKSLLQMALKRLEHNRSHSLIVEQKNGTLRLPLEDIRYFFSEKRLIHAVMANRPDAIFYDRLKALEEKLPNYFVRIHRRYLINLNFVTAFGSTCVKLGETTLPIGRTYKPNATAAFVSLQFNQGDNDE